jgi:hypothetical protein
MQSQQRKSRKTQVGNRKAGSRKQQSELSQLKGVPFTRAQYENLSRDQKRFVNPRGTQPLGANSTSVAAAYSAPIKNNRPRISYGENGRSCRVQHKEFIQNVSGTTNFTVALFLALNPGLAGTFPWLSNIANNFEQYRVRMMRFCYLTRTGTNIPGSVLMAPDYDASDVQPVSEQIMSNYAEIVEDAPWKDICCLLRPSGMHALGPKKFVRNGIVPGQDLKTTDVGTFILATVDGTNVNWGKLWVEYDVEFYEPQLNPNGSSLATTAQGTAGTTAAVISAGLAIAGPLISSVVGNVVSFQNLVPGGEYFITVVGTAYASNVVYSALVGFTSKNPLENGAVNGEGTFLATASSGSITMTSGGAITSPLIVVAPISIGTL